MSYYTIYQITNLVNNKIYIGCHKTIDPYDGYMGSGKLLNEAIKKYGLSNFKKDVIYIFDNPDEMYSKEAEIVNDDFILREDTYNIKRGGTGGWDHIDSKDLWKNDEYRSKTIGAMKETRSKLDYREKRSEITKNIFKDLEIRNRHKESVAKVWEDSEKCKNHSDTMKKVWEDSGLRERQSQTQKRICNDPNHLKKKSNIMKEKWKDPEFRKKQRESRVLVNKDTIWIYSEKDDTEKQIHKDKPIPQGYRKGRRRRKK